MFARRHSTVLIPLCLIVCIAAAPLRADTPAVPDLYKAYYLEHQSHDYVAARRLYQSVLHQNPTGETRTAAKAGADRCRDQLAATNFATLMPPETIGYLEISRPGEIIEKLCAMLGLTTEDMQAVLAERPSVDDKGAFHVPQHFVISPALFQHLGAFGGAAFAMTNFEPKDEGEGKPSGVLAIHHGDATLLKGLLETAFQFAPTGEKIGDLPTFAFTCPEMGKITGVLTECLLIIGTSRELVEGSVARLTTDAPSLASREDLKDLMTQRTGATIFAFCDIQSTLRIAKTQMSERDRREFNMANAIGDVDSLRWASFSLGIHEGILGAQVAVRLADDHHSLVYNLMRLPPMSRKCLASVPANAAGIVGLGLNPALVNAAVDKAQRDYGKGVTGFDIGREFFGNIQELCGFVMPGAMKDSEAKGTHQHIPNGGIILAVNDVARSKALWNQLLSLPGIIDAKEPVQPETSKIGETDVTSYLLPHVGKVYLAELNGCIAITTTRPSLKACIQAQGREKSILKDEVMGPVIARMPKDSSIMFAANIGRAAEMHMTGGNGAENMAMGQAKQMCSKMVVWAGIGQSPNQLTLQVAVGGLPNVNEALKTYGPMINSFANMAMQQNSHSHDRKVARKSERKKVAKPVVEEDKDGDSSDE